MTKGGGGSRGDERSEQRKSKGVGVLSVKVGSVRLRVASVPSRRRDASLRRQRIRAGAEPLVLSARRTALGREHVAAPCTIAEQISGTLTKPINKYFVILYGIQPRYPRVYRPSAIVSSDRFLFHASENNPIEFPNIRIWRRMLRAVTTDHFTLEPKNI